MDSCYFSVAPMLPLDDGDHTNTHTRQANRSAARIKIQFLHFILAKRLKMMEEGCKYWTLSFLSSVNYTNFLSVGDFFVLKGRTNTRISFILLEHHQLNSKETIGKKRKRREKEGKGEGGGGKEGERKGGREGGRERSRIVERARKYSPSPATSPTTAGLYCFPVFQICLSNTLHWPTRMQHQL